MNHLIKITLAFTVCFLPIGVVMNGYSDSQWLLLLGAALFTAVLSDVHAEAQAWYINSGKHPKHFLLFCARAVFALFISYLIYKDLHNAINLSLYMGAWFWLVFDARLNHYRGKAIFYVSEYYRSALLDRAMSAFFKRVKIKPHFLLMLPIKILLIVWTIYRNVT